MNQKQKGWLAAGLALLSGGVWGPQFLASEEPPAFVEERGVEGLVDNGVEWTDPVVEESRDGADERSTETAAHTPVGGAGGGAPSFSDPSRRLRELEQQLASDAAHQDAQPEPSMHDGRDSSDSRLAALVRALESTAAGDQVVASRGAASGASARLQLERFAEANALRGILHGPEESMALLGSSIVRPGEVLDGLDGGASLRVAAIDAGGVRLAVGGEELFLRLPPFVARETPDPLSLSDPLSRPESAASESGMESSSAAASATQTSSDSVDRVERTGSNE